jgi:site-specific DNA-methyltransferase (adenine-specific)
VRICSTELDLKDKTFFFSFLCGGKIKKIKIMIEINKNYNESNLETMARMPDNFIDLTVTSPPYDNLRQYKGYSFDFENVAKELFRVTKQGGVVVWVVGDATIKGSETGTSFRQALYFKEIGFNLHDTMIYRKLNPIPLTHNRYEQEFEYMFVFSKGKPNTFNPIKIPTKLGGKKYNPKRPRDYDNHSIRHNRSEVLTYKMEKIKGNIFEYIVGAGNDKTNHSATFPEELTNDHIVSWSNEGDLVYDPFMGSGTTAKMSILNNRNWVGSEISSEYCKIIEERVKKAWEEKRKEKDLQAGTLFGGEM